MAAEKISVRLGAELIAELDEYAETHGLDRGIVIRLALSNQFGRKPPKNARERFERKPGNPNPSEAGKAGAAALWKDK